MSGRPRTGVSRSDLLEKGHKNIIVGELILEYLFANRLQCRVPADLLFSLVFSHSSSLRGNTLRTRWRSCRTKESSWWWERTQFAFVEATFVAFLFLLHFSPSFRRFLYLSSSKCALSFGYCFHLFYWSLNMFRRVHRINICSSWFTCREVKNKRTHRMKTRVQVILSDEVLKRICGCIYLPM